MAMRDVGRRGESLDDFARHPYATGCMLEREHVIALRLYTTEAFSAFNVPLRGMQKDGGEHPYPVIVSLIAEGIGMLITLLPYCLTTLLSYHLTTLLSYYLTILLPYYLTTLLPYYLTTLLPYYLTTLLPYYLTYQASYVTSRTSSTRRSCAPHSPGRATPLRLDTPLRLATPCAPHSPGRVPTPSPCRAPRHSSGSKTTLCCRRASLRSGSASKRRAWGRSSTPSKGRAAHGEQPRPCVW